MLGVSRALRLVSIFAFAVLALDARANLLTIGFDDLPSLTTVTSQYGNRGVYFSGSPLIAVGGDDLNSDAFPPSSPPNIGGAGPEEADDNVPASIFITFDPAILGNVTAVQANITGSRAIFMIARDAHGNVISQDQTDGPNLGGRESVFVTGSSATPIASVEIHDHASFFGIDDLIVGSEGLPDSNPDVVKKLFDSYPTGAFVVSNDGLDVISGNDDGAYLVKDGVPQAGYSKYVDCCAHPVNLATGLMWHSMTDFTAKGRTEITSLVAKRAYLASPIATQGDFGKSWFGAWEEKLLLMENGKDYLYLDENGSGWIFTKQSDGSFRSPPSSFMKFEAFSDRFAITKKGAEVHTFSGKASVAPPGAIIEISEPHGEKILFGYTGGKLSSVETALAGKVVVSRNSQGLVSKLTRVRDGYEYTYDYSPDGKLLVSRDQAGRETRYEYRSDGKLVGIMDPIGRSLSFVYDASGRMANQSEFGDGFWSFTYTSGSDETRVTDVRSPDGRITRFIFDTNFELRKKISADGGVEEYTYNEDRQVVSKKDALGGTTVYTYDAHGNLASVKAPLDPSPVRMSYDLTFDVPKSITPIVGAEIAFVLNPVNGDRTMVSRTSGADALSLSLANDAFGNVVTRTNPYGSYSDVRDGNGLLNVVFDARNSETRTYDSRARVTKRTFANGRVLAYAYDDLDRVTSITDSNGPDQVLVYDDADRVVEKRVSAGSETQTTRYAWDARDRLVSMTNAKGEVTRWNYDEAPSPDTHPAVHGNPTSMVDAKGRVTRYEYDSMDRLALTVDPSGAETRMRYDLRGDLKELEDDGHRVTRFFYDANRRLVRRERPVALGNGARNQSAVETTLYAYDAAGKLTREESFSNEATKGEHQITEIAYDAFDRMIGKRLSRKKGTTAAVVEENATYRYADLLETNLMIEANNEMAKLAFRFEAVPPFQMNSYAVAATPGGATFGVASGNFTLTHDPSGEISEVKRGSDLLYSKTYDPAGRLARVAAGGGKLRAWTGDFTYDGFGRLVLRKDSGSVSEALTYDVLNRVAELTWKEKSKTVISKALDYDAVGNIVKSEREDFASSFGYDERDELEKIASHRTGTNGHGILHWLFSKAPLPDALNQDFAYDSVGNRTKSDSSPGAEYLENQIVSDRHHVYVSDSDGLGRLTLETDLRTRLQKRFGYRADARLVSFEKTFDEDHDADYDPRDPILTKVSYAYDALGRRIGKRFERSCRRFKRTFSNSFTYLGSKDRILLGKDGSGNEFLYVDGNGIDEHLAQVSKREAKSYLTDHLGSVLNGEAAAGLQAFGPYGETLGIRFPVHGGSDPAQYGFTGRSYDLESGVYYYRARMYDPRTGRFLSKDPIGLGSGDLNIYRYVQNSPVRHADPTGLIVFDSSGVTRTPAFQNSAEAMRLFEILDHLPYVVSVSFAMVSGDGAWTGQVNDNETTINIDPKQIRVEDLARTAYHELFHAYQQALNRPVNETEAQFYEEAAFGKRKRNQCGAL